ncbi:MAG: hypothetical protein WAM50_13395 [Pseudolabrys sp.]
MADNRADLDPSTWDPALDAVVAAPKHHKVIFENERLRVLEVTLEPNDEEPIHHHRWPSVFVFDQMQGPVHDVAPDGTKLPPNRDVMQAVQNWNGHGCLVSIWRRNRSDGFSTLREKRSTASELR